MIDIYDRFKEIREKMGLTQMQLASNLGMSQSDVSKIENKKTAPDVLLILKFCDLAGISIDEFLQQGHKEPFIVSPDLRVLLEKAKRLNSEQVRKLNEFLETMVKR